jgi:hypothetical protein
MPDQAQFMRRKLSDSDKFKEITTFEQISQGMMRPCKRSRKSRCECGESELGCYSKFDFVRELMPAVVGLRIDFYQNVSPVLRRERLRDYLRHHVRFNRDGNIFIEYTIGGKIVCKSFFKV